MNRTVSVIIPAYNQAHYLGLAIQSALDQQVHDVEIVVVDDGSTDNTRQVAQAFTDTRVRYVYQENQGLSAARNTGIRLATGQFITFLDSDDLFLPEKLTLLMAEMAQRPFLGFVAGEAILIDEANNHLPHRMDAGLPQDSRELLLGNPLHVGSVLVRREWLAQAGDFDESLRACEDWDMWLRLARCGCQMAFVAQPVSLYRVHQAQMTRQAERMRTAMLAVLDKFFADDNAEIVRWQPLKDKAYAAAYVRAAARAYHAGGFADASADLATAVTLDPTLLQNEAQPLVNQLNGWANAPMADDPLAYLEGVYHHLPTSLQVLVQRRNRELGEVALRQAFTAYRAGDYQQVRSLVWQAIRYQPQIVLNRGALSIWIRSEFKRDVAGETAVAATKATTKVVNSSTTLKQRTP